MTVSPVTLTDAAASMSHPDHDRWVKERTLAMEVAHHVGVMGGTYRDAEDANTRMLARMDARARLAPTTVQPTTPAPRTSRDERNAERGVSVMAPQPDVETPDPFRCSRCKSHSAHGHCRSCKAHQRLAAILRLASAGNPEIRALFLPYGTSALHAQAKAGPFLGMSQRDINRIITAQTEQLCDQSVRYLGAWQ